MVFLTACQKLVVQALSRLVSNKSANRLRPEFLLFFVLPTLSTQFLENWKKKKIFFQFNFSYFSPTRVTVVSTEVDLCFFVLSFLLQPG